MSGRWDEDRVQAEFEKGYDQAVSEIVKWAKEIARHDASGAWIGFALRLHAEFGRIKKMKDA
jgi:hypothetical protein